MPRKVSRKHTPPAMDARVAADQAAEDWKRVAIAKRCAILYQIMRAGLAHCDLDVPVIQKTGCLVAGPLSAENVL